MCFHAHSMMRSSSEKAIRSNPKAVVLFGPTAVGKTAMTENLFSKGFEIINADSIQVYRGLDIGSAKPDPELRKKIKHHLVDIRDPWEDYNSGEFCIDAISLIHEINSRGSIPLITGGTAYYFRQLMYLPAKTPQSDPWIRKSVKEEISAKGDEWAYSYLSEVDPASAMRINSHDMYRVSRAIEVYRQTGMPLSSFPVSDTIRDDVDFAAVGLRRPKAELDKRIAMRVDMMFDMGFYDEIKRLIREGAQPSWPSMEAIGYREFFEARENPESSLRSIKESIIRNSSRYAKRQMTFFQSFSDAVFFHPEDEEGIRRYIESKLGIQLCVSTS